MSHHVVNPAVQYIVMIICLINAVVLTWHLMKSGGAVERSKLAQHLLTNAAVCIVAGLIAIVDQEWFFMWINAAVTAVSLILWWHIGGGDGTKRRLKKLKEKFVGKRRTAPVTA